MNRHQTMPDSPAVLQPNNWSVIVPEARTNLITNPSFERDATGWSAVGTGVSIARDATTSYFGGACGKMIDTASTGAGEYVQANIATVTAGQTYTLSYRYKKTCIHSGTGVAAVFIRDAGTTIISQPSRDLRKGTVSDWVYESFTFVVPTGGVDARVFFATNGVASGAFTLWVDGVQLEQGGYATTYIDGDQEGCYWLGEPHLSASARYSWARQGGKVVNLQDFKFVIAASIGIGAPPYSTISTDYALGGAQYQNSIIPARDFTIAGAFMAETKLDLINQRRALLDIIKPGAASPLQPVRLVWQRVDYQDNVVGEPAYVDAVYTGGLEGNDASAVSEQVALGFRVHLPYIATAGNDTGISLDSYDEFSVVAYQSKILGSWEDSGSSLTSAVTAGPVEDIKKRQIYIARGDTVYRWDGVSWTSIGATNASQPVNDMIFAPDGNLYVVGAFTTIGGVAANRVAKWNGSAWSAMSTGLVSAGYSIVWTKNNTLIAGDYVVQRWDGAAWQQIVDLSDGANLTFSGTGRAYDIEVAANGDLWVATNVYNLQATVVGCGGGTRLIYGIFVIPYENQISGTWCPVIPDASQRPNDIVTHLAPDQRGNMHAAGTFTQIGTSDEGEGYAIFNRSGGVMGVSVNSNGWFTQVTPTSLDVGSDGTVYMGSDGTSTFQNGDQIVGASMIRHGPNPGNPWQHGGVTDAPSGGNVVAVLDSSYGLMVGSSYSQGYPSITTTVSESTAPTPVTFEITGPCNLASLNNFTTGAAIIFNNLEVLSTERIRIGTGPTPYIVSDRRGDLVAFLAPGSNLYTFMLQNGENRIGALATGGDQSGLITLYYRPRFDSLDR